MISKVFLKLYKWLYSWLILLYPISFYDRFASELEYTFNDLLEEKLKQKTNLLSFVAWIYLETFTNIFKENITFYLMKPSIFIRTRLITALILLIPFIAMQFSTEMTWSAFDFVLAGILIFLACFSIEFFIARNQNIYYRLAAIITALTTIFLIISNGAVGIIGNENQTFNLWYFAVSIVIIIGSLISQFKSKAMSYTSFLAAATQALITITALLLGLQKTPGSSVQEILLINGFFIALYIASGILFYKSSLNSSASAKSH